MNFKELKEIIDYVTTRDSIEEFEIEKSGVRIRIKRGTVHPGGVSSAPVISASVASSSIPATVAPTPAQISVESEDLFYIKSPIVGTFYKSPNPASVAFASVGD